jgi:DNA-binding CsgD family transcriptional regulator
MDQMRRYGYAAGALLSVLLTVAAILFITMRTEETPRAVSVWPLLVALGASVATWWLQGLIVAVLARPWLKRLRVLDAEVVEQLLSRRRRDEGLSSLTTREREVLALMAEGRSNRAIAGTLFVTGGAVEKHVKSIFGKLGLAQTGTDHRRVLAVLAYLRG